MSNKLAKTKRDERTGIEYTLVGDYYIPNLSLSIIFISFIKLIIYSSLLNIFPP